MFATDLFPSDAAVRSRAPKWRCLPCPGTYPAAKIPIPVPPPAKNGDRKVAIADGFAGGGGATEGIELALQQLHGMELLPYGHPMHVTYAVNHDDAAITMHKANHPRTIHLPANVWQVSMREMLGDDLFGLLWLSPDCRDHSSAKGGPITSRAVRDLAWVAIKYLKELPDWQRPWTICLENVSAFAKWSPLIERPDGNGYMRDPERLGWTFHQFVHALSRYGYSIGWKEIVACEHGDPTIRKRLKLVARRDGLPVEWPEATHADPKSDAVKAGALQPWPVAADILDWSLDCPSIFMTKEEGKEYTKKTGKRVIRPLAPKTDARLAYGVKRHVMDAGDDAFIVTCNHSGEGFRGQPLSEPFATVARARDAHGLVVPHMMTMRNSGSPTSGADEPTRTIMAGGANQFAVETAILPHVAVFRGDSIGKNVLQPLPTPTANSFIKRPGGATPIGMVETSAVPFISRGQHGGGIRPATDPFHTIAASDGDQNQVAAVYLAQHNTGEEGHSPLRPVSTIVQKGCTQGVVAASMLSLKGSERRDGSCKDAHPAVCASGQHSAVVTLPLVTAYYGCGDGFPLDQPMWSATTHDRFGLAECFATVPPLSDAQWARARQVAEFLRAHGCWDGGEIVTLTIRGTAYVIVDIGMRMLTPRELARAQGFPDSYILNPIFRGKPLSETEQRHKIGNSVCRRPAAAVIVSNYRPPLEWGRDTVPFMEAAE